MAQATCNQITKFDGSLLRIHRADEDAIYWLKTMATTKALTKQTTAHWIQRFITLMQHCGMQSWLGGNECRTKAHRTKAYRCADKSTKVVLV